MRKYAYMYLNLGQMGKKGQLFPVLRGCNLELTKVPCQISWQYSKTFCGLQWTVNKGIWLEDICFNLK